MGVFNNYKESFTIEFDYIIFSASSEPYPKNIYDNFISVYSIIIAWAKKMPQIVYILPGRKTLE
jgi:hypothetical protein